MWQGEPCQDCRTLEDELKEVRDRLKEATDELDELKGKMGDWVSTVDQLSTDIGSER